MASISGGLARFRSALIRSSLGEALAFRVALASDRVRSGEDGGADYVLAPPGQGNIGDQAMIAAFIAGAPRPVVISMEEGAVPHSSVSILQLRELVYPTTLGRYLKACKTLGRILTIDSTFSVIGADIMDGRYNRTASVLRSRAAVLATKMCQDVRVLGFSWNGSAERSAIRAISRASSAGVRIFARDPQSLSRLHADGVLVAEYAPDIVFTTTDKDTTLLSRMVNDEILTRPFAIVNISGLISSTYVNQYKQYERIVEFLKASGFSVLLLPHVFRHGTGDLDATMQLETALPYDAVHTIRNELSPAQVRGLAADATLVVTGRMHLAIQSVMHGTPAITFASQGKVGGLYEALGMPELCIEPGEDMATSTIDTIKDLVKGGEVTRANLVIASRKLGDLAQKNFEGLCSPSAQM